MFNNFYIVRDLVLCLDLDLVLGGFVWWISLDGFIIWGEIGVVL